jgi:hypothetical protein
MICEVLPEIIDCEGNKVSKPKWKKHWFMSPTHPVGVFISAKIEQHCQSIEEIQSFLQTCKYVSDIEQFNKDDYWLSPDRFEVVRKGDCEDFALWAWRQLIQLGYESRLVAGRVGVSGHAWVTYQDGGRWYILEATAASQKRPYPALRCKKYQPEISIKWNGKKLEYYEHRPNTSTVPAKRLLLLYPDWICFHLFQWSARILSLPAALFQCAKLLLKHLLEADESKQD